MDTCRVCLSETSKTNGSITDLVIDGKKISKVIEDITGIKVSLCNVILFVYVYSLTTIQILDYY
jgi:hypothetical protein